VTIYVANSTDNGKYTHDAPDLGGSSSYTGYAVQTGGATIGVTN